MKQGSFVGIAAIAIASLPLSARSQVTVGRSFETSRYGVDVFFSNPDPMGAVGPDHFVELINGHYGVYLKSTGARIVSQALDDFWFDAGAAPAGFAYDPRVLFDPGAQRWYACSADNPQGVNAFLFAVSRSADPTQGWVAFRIPGDSPAQHWVDFDTMGFTSDRIVLAANAYTFDNADIVMSIIVLPKADLLGPAPSVANRTALYGVSPTRTGYTPHPIIDYSGATADSAVLSDYNPSAGVIKLTAIAGSPNAAVLGPSGGLTAIPAVFDPPLAIQPFPGFLLDAGDSRFASPPIRALGSLWTVHAISASGRSAVKWYQIDESTRSVVRQGVLAHPTLALTYPSLAINAAGDIVIACTGVSSTEFAGSFAMVGRVRSSGVSFSSPIRLRAGAATFFSPNSSRNRWGDYSAVSPDPIDPRRFWCVNEVVVALDTYSTHVTEVIVCRADFNNDQTLTIHDLFDFLADYFAGHPDANVNDADGVNVIDIFDYLSLYFAGC